MKIVLFVEGHTERMALPKLLKRWLDPQLPRPIGIKVVRFEGWRDYYDEIGKR
jgi:predicted ATP-dependent endonuclease of OLD family